MSLESPDQLEEFIARANSIKNKRKILLYKIISLSIIIQLFFNSLVVGQYILGRFTINIELVNQVTFMIVAAVSLLIFLQIITMYGLWRRRWNGNAIVLLYICGTGLNILMNLIVPSWYLLTRVNLPFGLYIDFFIHVIVSIGFLPPNRPDHIGTSYIELGRGSVLVGLIVGSVYYLIYRFIDMD